MVIDESSSRDDRARIRTQVELIARANQGRVGWDSEQPEEFTYLFDPDAILVRQGFEDQVREALQRSDRFDGELADAEYLERELAADERLGLVRQPLPGRRDGDPRRVPLALDLLDEAFGLVDDKAPEDGYPYSPDHWLHVAPGSTKLCPESEPQETGLHHPWPPLAGDASLGKDVRVSVVDSGWHPPAAGYTRTPWLASGVDGDDENNGPQLRQYAGHGTFIAGVVKCIAPATDVRVEGFLVNGGALLESEMVIQLRQTLRHHKPQVINLSAGATTRRDRPLFCFERFWEQDLAPLKDTCLLVAAAGNDGSSHPFWPAAFPWALGVGSLDRSGDVSSFSNYGDSADVYALGRNIINAYPKGTYVCREAPDTGDVRRFRNGLARWSGTSFAAPVVVGLIAARLTAGGSVHQARDDVLAGASPVTDPAGVAASALVGPYS